MSPEEQYLLQQILGITPEYSISRGWQPVDGGTVSQSTNVLQDRMQLGGDVLMQILMGSFDPSSLEQIADPDWQPEAAPVTPLADMYSQDPVLGTAIELMRGGALPRDAVLTAKFEIDGVAPDLDDEQVAEDVKYLTEEAAKVQGELAEVRAFEAQGQQAPMVDSPMAEQFRELGIPTGSYTPEMLNPELGAANEKAVADLGALDKYKAAYEVSKSRLPEMAEQVQPLWRKAMERYGLNTGGVERERGDDIPEGMTPLDSTPFVEDLGRTSVALSDALGSPEMPDLGGLAGGFADVVNAPTSFGHSMAGGLGNYLFGSNQGDEPEGGSWAPSGGLKGSVRGLGAAAANAAANPASRQAARTAGLREKYQGIKDQGAFDDYKNALVRKNMSEWERKKQAAVGRQAMSGRNLQRDWLMQTLSGLPGVS